MRRFRRRGVSGATCPRRKLYLRRAPLYSRPRWNRRGNKNGGCGYPSREFMTQTANSPGSGAWEAFEREAMPHADGLFRFAVWLVRDRGEAEDLVQETM